MARGGGCRGVGEGQGSFERGQCDGTSSMRTPMDAGAGGVSGHRRLWRRSCGAWTRRARRRGRRRRDRRQRTGGHVERRCRVDRRHGDRRQSAGGRVHGRSHRDWRNRNRRHDVDRLCVRQFVLDRGVGLRFRDLQLHLRQRALLAVVHHPHGRHHGHAAPVEPATGSGGLTGAAGWWPAPRPTGKLRSNLPSSRSRSTTRSR